MTTYNLYVITQVDVGRHGDHVVPVVLDQQHLGHRHDDPHHPRRL